MAKNTVKAADVRTKTDKELETRLAELRKEQFNLRFQKATGQLANTARVNHVRKEIAKILTIVGERQRTGGQPTAKKTAKSAKKSAA
ncbi:MAG: 50S ribosomal protein L29 [Alphaproteobacteria bacterium]|nr:50S ribosomal protein L29 [Alphaproteobacteria bacterium]